MDGCSVNMEKLVGVATDGAPAVVASNIGFAGLLKQKFKGEHKELECSIILHCIVHQQNLAAKTLKMENVLKIVKQAVIYIRSNGLKHQQF